MLGRTIGDPTVAYVRPLSPPLALPDKDRKRRRDAPPVDARLFPGRIADQSLGALDGKEIMRSNNGLRLETNRKFVTHRWREVDSNFQFRGRGTGISIPLPFRCGASMTKRAARG